MDITTNVKLRLDNQYTFSISQEIDSRDLVEVALLYGSRFVPCNLWATNWVGVDYDDDVIRKLDAVDVLEALCYAKNYVYTEAWDGEVL